MRLLALLVMVSLPALSVAPVRAEPPPAMPPPPMTSTTMAPGPGAPLGGSPGEASARGRARARAYAVARERARLDASTARAPARRSTGVALGLSIGATAAGVGMVALSSVVDPRNDAAELGLLGGGVTLALVGPSMGRIYLGRGGSGLLLSLGRAASATLLVASWDDSPGGEALGVLGAAALVGLTVYDVASVPAVARSRRGVTLAPTAASRGGEHAVGLVAGGAF